MALLRVGGLARPGSAPAIRYDARTLEPARTGRRMRLGEQWPTPPEM